MPAARRNRRRHSRESAVAALPGMAGTLRQRVPPAATAAATGQAAPCGAGTWKAVGRPAQVVTFGDWEVGAEGDALFWPRGGGTLER